MEAHVQISQIIVIQITVELLYYYIVIVCMTSIILTKKIATSYGPNKRADAYFSTQRRNTCSFQFIIWKKHFVLEHDWSHGKSKTSYFQTYRHRQCSRK